MLSPEPNLEIRASKKPFWRHCSPFVLLLLLAAGVFFFNNTRQVGASMIRLGERISGESARRQSAGPAPPTVAPSSITAAPGPPEFATVAPRLKPALLPRLPPSTSGSGSADSDSQNRRCRSINSTCATAEFQPGSFSAGTQTTGSRKHLPWQTARSNSRCELIFLHGLNTPPLRTIHALAFPVIL